MKSPLREESQPVISVWIFAQDCYANMGRGIVHYPGPGNPASYVKQSVFTYLLGESAKEIRKALAAYNPDNEMMIAVPSESNSKICDYKIINKKHPLANLRLGMNIAKDDDFV